MGWSRSCLKGMDVKKAIKISLGCADLQCHCTIYNYFPAKQNDTIISAIVYLLNITHLHTYIYLYCIIGSRVVPTLAVVAMPLLFLSNDFQYVLNLIATVVGFFWCH